MMNCLLIDIELHNGVPKYGPAKWHEQLQEVKEMSAGFNKAR